MVFSVLGVYMSQEIVEFENKKLRIITEGKWPEGVTLFDLVMYGARLKTVVRLENKKAYTACGFYIESNKWAIEVQDEKADDQKCGKIDLKQQIEPVYEKADNDLHDSHYKKVASEFIENIKLQEYMMLKDIPDSLHDIVLRNFNLATAMKYPLRMGEKDDWEKELMKMENYTHRARTKGWIK